MSPVIAPQKSASPIDPVFGSTNHVVATARSIYTKIAGSNLNPFFIQGAKSLLIMGRAITPSHRRSRMIYEASDAMKIINVLI
jgi:hypothetical protein